MKKAIYFHAFINKGDIRRLLLWLIAVGLRVAPHLFVWQETGPQALKNYFARNETACMIHAPEGLMGAVTL